MFPVAYCIGAEPEIIENGETLKRRRFAKPKDVLERLTTRLWERLLTELDRTEECEEFQNASPENRVRVLTGIFKALQGVEQTMMRMGRDSKDRSDGGINVVEFRRQLEEQIARLVEQEASEAVSGEAE